MVILFFTFLFFFETAVIFTLPDFLPVTTPFLDTVATLRLLLFHVTALLALLGETDLTVILAFPLMSTFFVVAFKTIFFGALLAALTVDVVIHTEVNTIASAMRTARHFCVLVLFVLIALPFSAVFRRSLFLL